MKSAYDLWVEITLAIWMLETTYFSTSLSFSKENYC